MTYNTSFCSSLANRINELAGFMQIKDVIPSVKVVDNGIILPRKQLGGISHNVKIPYQGLGGVVDKDGKLVKESSIYDLKIERDVDRIAFGGAYSVSNPVESEETAIYLGLAHRHWGHFLIDIVQRCWYPMVKGLLAKQTGNEAPYFDGNELTEDYVYVFSGFGDSSTEFTGNYKEFFRLLGLDCSKMFFANNPVLYKRVLVPDVAVHPGEYITTAYKTLFDIVIHNAMAEAVSLGLNTAEQIYFSREHLKDTKDMGENHIEKLMIQCGYKVLYPEELTLVEQIFCWQTAKEIACINGTIPHNCVFAHESLRLYVFNKMELMVGYQFTMDMVQGITPIYVEAYNEPFKRYPLSVSRGPFWISATENVRRFVSEQYGISTKADVSGIGDWINYLVRCGIAESKYQLRGNKAKIKNMLRKIGKI